MFTNLFRRVSLIFSPIIHRRNYVIFILASAVSAAITFMIIASQPDSIAKSADTGRVISETNGKVRRYANDVYKVEPENFAVSRSVSEMETVFESVAEGNRTTPDNQEKEAVRKATQILRDKDFDSIRVAKGLPPLTEIERTGREINRENKRTVKIIPGAGLGTRDFTDSLVNNGISPDAPQTMPLPSLTFDGVTSADNRTVNGEDRIPPDPNGDVGPNHYVSSVNVVFKVFNKAGAVVAGPINTGRLWSSLPATDQCRRRNDGDPMVVYDSLADRWIITQYSVPRFREFNITEKNYQCIAVSTTSDPTGSYYTWSYIYSDELLNDYSKIGVWTDAYHITGNQFDSLTREYRGVGILSQDRAKALVGNPATSVIYRNAAPDDPFEGSNALPADIDGIVPPPVGMAEVFAQFRANEYGDQFDAIRYFKWVPNFTSPGSSVLTVLPDVRLAEFDGRFPPDFVGGSIEVAGGELLGSSISFLHRLAYRNLGSVTAPISSLTGNFTVNVSGVNPTTPATYQTGIRWFEMRRTDDAFSVFDQGTHNQAAGNGATGINNWMGSLAQDYQGNIALGFSQASTTQNADIKIAGRTNNVAGSGTLNEGEALLFDALGAQTGGSARWGDYSSMSVDPADDCTFWYTQEYYATTSDGGWSTRVGKFKYPGCAAVPKATLNGTITSCSTGLSINNAEVNATGGFNRISAANGTYTMTVAPGTYTLSANRSSGFVGTPQTVTVANGATATADICLTGFPEVSVNANPVITAESCGIANGTPEPGELLTVSLPITNIGGAAATNLTATLLPTDGVVNPSATQSYGAIAVSSSAVVRNFTFRVNPGTICGESITLTWNIRDGVNNLGTISKTYSTGRLEVYLSENFDSIITPNLPSGWTQTRIVGSSDNWITNRGAATTSIPNRLFISSALNQFTRDLTSVETPAFTVTQANSTFYFAKVKTLNSDGVALDIKIGNGPWQDVITAGGVFVQGEYDTVLRSNGNPLDGRGVWTDGFFGFDVNEPTELRLPPNTNGQSVKFRWLLGTIDVRFPNRFIIDDVRASATNVICNTNCAALTSRPRADFDGDGKTDLSVYRPNEGNWYLNRSTAGFAALNFGLATDTVTPRDFDGDGKTDLSVFRPTATAGTVDFYVLRSSNNTVTGAEWGTVGDVPVVADYDGDGKADYGIWRGSTGDFWILQSQTGTFRQINFGLANDKPVPADYNGDNKADFAVYRPSAGTWYFADNVTGAITVTQFGLSTDIPVPADYDGDGKYDIAVFRPNSGVWYILKSSGGITITQFGLTGDVPVPGDYDGDGKYDIAVYRNGIWYVDKSTSGVIVASFGLATDIPIPSK